MKKDPLVSVIIPTYNRAHLIGETLDSVLAQTYENWECIIVDDGSSDHTDEIVGKYVKKDSRFKYYHRPEKYSPGGNGARNYGLNLAQGKYIVFFDSDDLMTEDHLQVKYDLIISGVYDFAITRTKYFNYTNKVIDRYYNFTTKDITKENYILQKINWLTYDIIVKSEVVEELRFNELLQSGQEYNFFSKLVCLTENGVFNDKVATLRRHHSNSKRTTIAAGNLKYKQGAIAIWFTFNETKNFLTQSTSKALLHKLYMYILRFRKIPKDVNSFEFWKAIIIAYEHKVFTKYIYYFVNKYTNRFHFLRKIALK